MAIDPMSRRFPTTDLCRARLSKWQWVGGVWKPTTTKTEPIANETCIAALHFRFGLRQILIEPEDHKDDPAFVELRNNNPGITPKGGLSEDETASLVSRYSGDVVFSPPEFFEIPWVPRNSEPIDITPPLRPDIRARIFRLESSTAG